MAYTIDHANNVAAQLEKFTTGYAHWVAGQFANLDFWMDEVVHALGIIEGYSQRFAQMSDAQQSWVEGHKTRVGVFCHHCGGTCEFAGKDGLWEPAKPTKMRSSDREQATRRLKDAAYYFLVRCLRMRLLDEAALRAMCERLGTSVDPNDFTRS